jgi:hypothetical protein
MADAKVANEAVLLSTIKLGVFPSMRDTLNIFCDNTASIANTKELMAHCTVKHIL